MRLSVVSINIEELNKHSSAKEFIDTLKKSREFVVEIFTCNGEGSNLLFTA